MHGERVREPNILTNSIHLLVCTAHPSVMSAGPRMNMSAFPYHSYCKGLVYLPDVWLPWTRCLKFSRTCVPAAVNISRRHNTSIFLSKTKVYGYSLYSLKLWHQIRSVINELVNLFHPSLAGQKCDHKKKSRVKNVWRVDFRPVREFRLPPRCTRDTRSSLFWDVTQRRILVTNVSGHPIGPVSYHQCLTIENGTDGLAQDVSN
jgi:hypothetical protein